MQEIRGRLETPRIGAPEAKQIIDAIQNLANRPPPNAAINLAPFHELARRIDAVRSAMDRQTDPGPQLASLASEVEEIRARLENSQIGAPEAKQIIDAIQSLADRSPANPAVDLAPFRELARRIDSVRSALEQRSGFTGDARGFEAKLTELNNNFGESLRAAYGVVDANLQRVMARLEDIAHRPDFANSADLGALRNLASLVESLRAAFEERGGFAGEAHALEAKLAELSDKLDDSLRAAAENQTISENLQLILARLEGIARQPGSAGSADLGALHDLVSGVEGLRAGVEEIRSRRDAAPIGAAEVKTLIDVIQDLAERVERQPAAPDLSAVEDMVREIASRSAAVDSPDVRALLRDVSEKIESGARFDVNALTDWMNRLEQRLQATDGARVERALRDLESRLASREYLSLDPHQVEAAAELIAQRLEAQNGLGANAETIFGQIADIQQRLDALSGVSESNAALERTIGDLITVFESTREHLQSAPMMERGDVGGLAEDLAELKAEQANADRRMAQRLNRVQEILEGLTDRLRELEDDRERPTDPGSPLVRPAPPLWPRSTSRRFRTVPPRLRRRGRR